MQTVIDFDFDSVVFFCFILHCVCISLTNTYVSFKLRFVNFSINEYMPVDTLVNNEWIV